MIHDRKLWQKAINRKCASLLTQTIEKYYKLATFFNQIFSDFLTKTSDSNETSKVKNEFVENELRLILFPDFNSWLVCQ
jgi:hypothetical protein